MAEYSMVALARRLDAVGPRRAKSLRALQRRIRWEWHWQGSGPLSARCLARTTGRHDLQQAFRAIDAANPPRSLREAYERLQFPLGGGVSTMPPGGASLRGIGDRIARRDVVSMRFASYNTYLMPGVELPFGRWLDDTMGWDALVHFNIPIGAVALAFLGNVSLPTAMVMASLDAMGVTPSKVVSWFTGRDLDKVTSFEAKPGWEARAPAIGDTLGVYDACCLCEVYNDTARHALRTHANEAAQSNYQAITGAEANDGDSIAGSGLYFLVRKFPVLATHKMVFSNRGKRLRDADSWTDKGVMLNVLDVGVGHVEVFQTHFFYGGGMLFGTPTDAQRMEVWRSALDELKGFFDHHHQPENIAIVTGDFNMDGANIRHYAEMRRRFDAMRLQDVWAWDALENFPSEGMTCRYTDSGSPTDGGGYEVYFKSCALVDMGGGRHVSHCDDRVGHAQPKKGVGRYDYVFLSRPAREHRFLANVSRVARRPYLIDSSGGYSSTMGWELFLSDHIALDCEFFFRAR
jgi:hypothetical protein